MGQDKLARQVGKTTLIHMFCKSNKIKLLEVNLERDRELRASFLKMDPEQIIADIQLFKKSKLDKNSLLFIDEIYVYSSHVISRIFNG